MTNHARNFELTEGIRQSRRLTLEQCAEILHFCYNTVVKLAKEAVANRENGTSTKDDFPCSQLRPHSPYIVYENNVVEWGKRKGLI